MNRLTLFILSGLIVAIAYLYIEKMILEHRVDVAEQKNSFYENQIKENQVWKDEFNQWRNKASTAEVSAATLTDLVKKGDERVAGLQNEFKNLKKDFSNLLSYSQAQTETISELKGLVSDTTIKQILGPDTTLVTGKKIKAKNDWNEYDITAFGDTAIIKRKGKEEFDTAVYWERLNKKGKKTIWPFGKKEWSSEMVSKNPETKIIKQSSLIIKKK